ncbi:PEGA domain-containing protein [Caldimonas tepidiphila]|uniref:PEGA domain-containing protein n=1 Tax=Caldimonas tepidiphila TaxID=2315841 RepID=UPI000E5AE51C|nr:PEGA domain-containing protein [Caldimonas tepidiphila]
MKLVLTAGVLALALSGCASIMNGSTQPVTIKSVPDGASVSVTNRAGEKIHNGTTPVTLTLNRGAGYFKSEEYRVQIKKEGFEPKELTIVSTVNGWYVANILFGGLIGMLAVDPATGAMYSFPEAVNTTLDAPVEKNAGSMQPLTIVSTDRLSPEVMKQARLVAAR